MRNPINWIFGLIASFDIWVEARNKKAFADIMEAEKRIAILERDISCIRATGKKYDQLRKEGIHV